MIYSKCLNLPEASQWCNLCVVLRLLCHEYLFQSRFWIRVGTFIKIVCQSVQPLASDMPVAVLEKASGLPTVGQSKRCVASEMLRLDEFRVVTRDTFVKKLLCYKVGVGRGFVLTWGDLWTSVHTYCQLSNGQRKMMKAVLMEALDNFSFHQPCYLNERLTLLPLKIFYFPVLQ